MLIPTNIFEEVNNMKSISELFIGRDDELIFCKNTFADINDIINNNKIFSITGLTQVGKTHFTKYFFERLKDEQPDKFSFYIVDAYTSINELEIYKTIFSIIYKDYKSLKDRYDLQSTPKTNIIKKWFKSKNKRLKITDKKIIDKILIDHCDQRINILKVWMDTVDNREYYEINETHTEYSEKKFSLEKHVDVGLRANLLTLITSELKTCLKVKHTELNSIKDTESRSYRSLPPTIENYINAIKFISYVVSFLKSNDEENIPISIIYLDDIDKYQILGKDKELVDKIIQNISILSKDEYISVIASMRDHFHDHHKHFRNLRYIPEGDYDFFLSVYKKRVENYNQVEFFSKEAIELLIEESNKIIGRFISYLNDIFKHYYANVISGKPISVDDIKKYWFDLYIRHKDISDVIIKNLNIANSEGSLNKIFEDYEYNQEEFIIKLRNLPIIQRDPYDSDKFKITKSFSEYQNRIKNNE